MITSFSVDHDAVDRVPQRADSMCLATDTQEQPPRPVYPGCAARGAARLSRHLYRRIPLVSPGRWFRRPGGGEDSLFKKQVCFLEWEDHEWELHKERDLPLFFTSRYRLSRTLLNLLVGGFLFLLTTSLLAPGAWDWKKITFATGAGFALFVVLTVPDHFLEQHL